MNPRAICVVPSLRLGHTTTQRHSNPVVPLHGITNLYVVSIVSVVSVVSVLSVVSMVTVVSVVPMVSHRPFGLSLKH